MCSYCDKLTKQFARPEGVSVPVEPEVKPLQYWCKQIFTFFTPDYIAKALLYNSSEERRQEKWDFRFLNLAKLVASWSKDPSTQTGAVIVDAKGSIVSLGYNGLPRDVDDSDERLNDRELKYKMIVHCERNAIIFAKRDLTGCTLYTYPFMSCAPCAGMVIQSGITRVVAPINDNPRWKADFDLSQSMFSEGRVEVDLLDYPVE